MRAVRRAALPAVVVLTVGGLVPASAAEPIVIVVTTTADVVGPDGQTSLREAVETSNADPGAYIIELPAGDHLLTSQLTVGGAEADLTIRGAGATATTIDAQGTSRIIEVDDAVLALEDLSLTGGRVTDAYGGAILATNTLLSVHRVHLHGNRVHTDVVDLSFRGGAMVVTSNTGSSHLEMTDTVFTDNAVIAGSDVSNEVSAGALYLSGDTTTFGIHRTRFSGNQVVASAVDQGAWAGALHVSNLGDGLSFMHQSTFDGNDLVVPPGHTALADAAALFLQDNDGDAVGHEIRTSNLTFEDNGASIPSASTVYAWSQPMVAGFEHLTLRTPGVGISSGPGVVELQNSAIEAAGSDCVGAAPTSTSGNVVSDTTCGVGVVGDLVDTAPGLGDFDTTTTPVPTVRLQPGAAALDQARLDETEQDARQLPRPVGPAPDSGAFEHQGPLASDDAATTDVATPVLIAVTSNDTSDDDALGGVTISSGPTSGTATPGAGGTVTFTPSAPGTASFTYEVCQQGFPLCDTADVTVTVDPVDEPTGEPTGEPTDEPTEDPTDAPGEQGVVRRSGGDRYDTAVLASQAAFDPGVGVAYVATGETFPDALAGAPLAARDGAPILLTRRDTLPEATATELDRLAPGRIVVLGGPVAVSPEVETVLAGYTSGAVTRLDGPDRYATAGRIAEQFQATGGTAYLATGANFPDALAGAAAAGRDGAPILLVSSTTVPQATADQLARLAPTRVVALGGTTAVDDTVLAAIQALTGTTPARLSGGDRYATAARVSATFDRASTVYVATGLAFPDALAGAPIAGAEPAPILLTHPAELSQEAVAELVRLAPARIVVLGGQAAISEQVAAALDGLVGS